MDKLRGLYVLDKDAFDLVYGDAERAAIAARVEILGPALTRTTLAQHPDLLRQTDVLFSGWGAPLMDARFLDAAPRLQAVFYAAGAINSWSTPEMFERGVRVTTASHANSVPVAEYTLATILFSLKHGWRLNRESIRQRTFVGRDDAPGNYRSTVGLVSMGMVARMVVKLLKPFDLAILAYDPFLSEDEAQLLGVRKVTLQTLFRESDAVSIRAPELEETRGMVDASLLRTMKAGATLINTARGSIINQTDLIEVLRTRPDLQAVLDVCDPEPPAADCPLFDLPNVMLTPHIAGSAGKECRRMSRYMVEELDRYLANKPLQWEITPEMTINSSHRPRSSRPSATPIAEAV